MFVFKTNILTSCLPNNVIHFFEIARTSLIYDSVFVKIIVRASHVMIHLPNRFSTHGLISKARPGPGNWLVAI